MSTGRLIRIFGRQYFIRPTISLEIVSISFSGKKFSFLKYIRFFCHHFSFLRFADCENLDAEDRLQRIRPFLDQVQELCQSKYIPSRNIAADETLMLYKGRLVCKLSIID
jgi:hypothetical protein